MTALAGPVAAAAHMLSQPFMARAYLAGSFIALCCGLVGYFVVIRAQVFAGDALSHVAFTGAMAALVAGVDLRAGLFGGCVGFGVALALLGRKGRPDDVVIGNTFVWLLGLGTLFLTVYTTSQSGGGTAGVSVLFGSVFGLSAATARTAALVGAGVAAALLAIARPLLFSSVDEAGAAARGVPVKTIGAVFLAIVGATAGEATQVVGALLLLGLVSAPAAAARRVTARPWLALALSGAFAVGSVWVGLALAYAVPALPPSSAIVGVAAGCYLVAAAGSARSDRWLNRESVGLHRH
ncbi:MAG: metal ABC transporter permease [Acidimicrobiales bacterium]